MQCDRMSNVEFRFVGTGWYRASMEMFLRMYVFVFQRPPPCVHLRGFPDKQNSMGLRIHTHRDRCTYICMCTICCVLFAAHWIFNSGASSYRRRTMSSYTVLFCECRISKCASKFLPLRLAGTRIDVRRGLSIQVCSN